MLVLIKVLIGVYIIAINFYAFMLLKFQRDAIEDGECGERGIQDGKIIITAILGGALGTFLAVFILKYRMKSLLFMVGMPVLIVLNIYMFILAFTGGFGFFYPPSGFD